MTDTTATFEIAVSGLEDLVEALIARAEAGETIILTRGGQPVACLGPPPPAASRLIEAIWPP